MSIVCIEVIAKDGYVYRCQIPVVLMGETGCGKTHLIRYMCKIAAYGRKEKNMFILKVINSLMATLVI